MIGLIVILRSIIRQMSEMVAFENIQNIGLVQRFIEGFETKINELTQELITIRFINEHNPRFSWITTANEYNVP